MSSICESSCLIYSPLPFLAFLSYEYIYTVLYPFAMPNTTLSTFLYIEKNEKPSSLSHTTWFMNDSFRKLSPSFRIFFFSLLFCLLLLRYWFMVSCANIYKNFMRIRCKLNKSRSFYLRNCVINWHTNWLDFYLIKYNV